MDTRVDVPGTTSQQQEDDDQVGENAPSCVSSSFPFFVLLVSVSLSFFFTPRSTLPIPCTLAHSPAGPQAHTHAQPAQRMSTFSVNPPECALLLTCPALLSCYLVPLRGVCEQPAHGFVRENGGECRADTIDFARTTARR